MPHNRPTLSFPTVNPAAAAVNSFASNFAKSFATFSALQDRKDLVDLKQKELDLKKTQADTASTVKLINLIDERDPAKQTLLAQTYITALGGDPKSESSKRMMAFFAKASDESRAALRKSLKGVGGNAPPGAVSAMLTAIVKGDISLVAAMERLEKIGDKAATRQALQAAGPGFSQTGGAGGVPSVRQRPLAAPGSGKEFGAFQPQVDRMTEAAGRLIDTGRPELAVKMYDALTKVKELNKRESAESAIGKEINDLQNARDRFGEGSFEYKAIQDSINAKRGGKASISETSTMRSQYIAASKTYREALTASSEIDKIMTLGGSPASDIALVTALVRITQPGGKISDADYRNAADIGSYGERIRQWMKKAATGEGLLIGQRLDIQNLARLTLAARRQNHSRVALQFGSLATRNGVDPRDVALITPKEIAGMSIQDAKSLLLLPLGVLTEKQLKAIDDRSRGISTPGGP